MMLRRMTKFVLNASRYFSSTTNAENSKFSKYLIRKKSCLTLRWYPVTFQQTIRHFCTTNESENVLEESTYKTLMTNLEAEKQVKMILIEYELAKQANLRIPSQITIEDMKELLNIYSVQRRQKYLYYLGKKELEELSDKRKKVERRKEMERYRLEKANKPPNENRHLEYGLGLNNMFTRITKHSVSIFRQSRLCHAAQFELPLVIDLSFENEMNRKEIKTVASQIQMGYAANRRSTEPFDLVFCNAIPESDIFVKLENYIPNLRHSTSMITVEEKNYLDLYPKEQLVYLTPDSPNYLQDYEGDKIYIVGGLVDLCKPRPLTLAKAKQQKIQTAKLPIDEYLFWECGSKSLTINQMVKILTVWKETNDWNKAFESIPRRKLKSPEEIAELAEKRSKRYGNAFSEKKNYQVMVSSFFNP